MQELLRCCAADFYLNRAGELGFFSKNMAILCYFDMVMMMRMLKWI